MIRIVAYVQEKILWKFTSNWIDLISLNCFQMRKSICTYRYILPGYIYRKSVSFYLILTLLFCGFRMLTVNGFSASEYVKYLSAIITRCYYPTNIYFAHDASYRLYIWTFHVDTWKRSSIWCRMPMYTYT